MLKKCSCYRKSFLKILVYYMPIVFFLFFNYILLSVQLFKKNFGPTGPKPSWPNASSQRSGRSPEPARRRTRVRTGVRLPRPVAPPLKGAAPAPWSPSRAAPTPQSPSPQPRCLAARYYLVAPCRHRCSPLASATAAVVHRMPPPTGTPPPLAGF